jgi:hypothetical protein
MQWHIQRNDLKLCSVTVQDFTDFTQTLGMDAMDKIGMKHESTENGDYPLVN